MPSGWRPLFSFYAQGMVLNVHERRVQATADAVGALLDTLSGRHDRLWPRADWPAIRFDRPLQAGAVGGHGPVRYTVSEYLPGRSVTFRFTGPDGFDGGHSFTVEPAGETFALLRHELTMSPRGRARITWPLFFRPLHDALIEDAFDRVECELGVGPRQRYRRSHWVRVLRLPFERSPRR